MGLKLEQVVPWGRCLEEYKSFFNLSDRDLQLKILDCAGGPASFNAEMTQEGYNVISCDPVYQFSVDEIEGRIQETYPVILAGVQANLDCYVWQDFQSPENLCQVRMTAMRQFLVDFPVGLEQGRYRVGELPSLPFVAHQFDLALCSHFLFSYSNILSLEFHLDAIKEICRVATEVRIFPLLNISGEVSPFLQPVIEKLEDDGYRVQIEQVTYEFQRGGDQLLKIAQIISGLRGL